MIIEESKPIHSTRKKIYIYIYDVLPASTGPKKPLPIYYTYVPINCNRNNIAQYLLRLRLLLRDNAQYLLECSYREFNLINKR
jgi:hypothetical protein